MTQAAERTAGPWLIANNGRQGRKSETFRIWRNDPGQDVASDHFRNEGYAVIAPHVHGEANARFIVTACNAHEELVAALRELVEEVRDLQIEGHQIRQVIGHKSWLALITRMEDARAALAKLEGK
jgi:hypothetical protein